MLDPFDERELVERARTDPGAFEALYRAYVDRVHAFAWRRTGSREEAEDVTATTFERALRSLPSFTWTGGGFGPWLFRIATNVVTDGHRARARQRSDRGQAAMALVRPLPAPDPSEALAEDDPVLRRALGRLTPRYQEALSLRFLAGLDHAEAAAALGCTRATLAVVVSRALAALRRELAEEGGDG